MFPVLLDSGISPHELPPYLRSVQALQVKGSPTAEIAAAVDRSRRVRPFYSISLATVTAAVLAGLALLYAPALRQTDVEFSPPAKVDFRPVTAPSDFGGPSGDAWLKSDLAVTGLQFGYQHLTPKGKPAQVLAERIELKVDGVITPFQFFQVANLSRNCPEGGWLCAKGSSGTIALEPGKR